MAPRRGKKKTKLEIRMDVAIAALAPLGFAKQMVRKVVKNLLKVYGDDAGWYFVEEGCYKLVIDMIVEEQENEKKMQAEEEDGKEKDQIQTCVKDNLYSRLHQSINCFVSTNMLLVNCRVKTIPLTMLILPNLVVRHWCLGDLVMDG